MPDFVRSTDAELVTAFNAGEQAAFSEILDRYADRVYSFHLAMLESPERAAEATRDTFVGAAAGLAQLDDGGGLRPWLFALAREELKADGRRRDHATRAGEPDSEDALRHLALEATDELGERERQLMHLHLVEGLEGDELATAAGIAPDNLEGVVSRMRRRVEGTLGALLIAELGSPECDEVDDVLSDWDGEYEPGVRARVNRHIGGCEKCRGRRELLLGSGNFMIFGVKLLGGTTCS